MGRLRLVALLLLIGCGSDETITEFCDELQRCSDEAGAIIRLRESCIANLTTDQLERCGGLDCRARAACYSE